eukprot:TRINITY_DN3538_c0_g1_i1.p1 TRINITY_DN3538_c0_g1~~TRINITY_DN3538_c0_g1_i1.p1  ORF type:complete len:718 (-),score=87.08 TRINITY_DN3538_c0_g1_i1:74-2227(-)
MPSDGQSEIRILMQQVGPQMGFLPAELDQAATLLENNWYDTCDSLSDLREAEAVQLRLQPRLLRALRTEALRRSVSTAVTSVSALAQVLQLPAGQVSEGSRAAEVRQETSEEPSTPSSQPTASPPRTPQAPAMWNTGLHAESASAKQDREQHKMHREIHEHRRDEESERPRQGQQPRQHQLLPQRARVVQEDHRIEEVQLETPPTHVRTADPPERRQLVRDRQQSQPCFATAASDPSKARLQEGTGPLISAPLSEIFGKTEEKRSESSKGRRSSSNGPSSVSAESSLPFAGRGTSQSRQARSANETPSRRAGSSNALRTEDAVGRSSKWIGSPQRVVSQGAAALQHSALSPRGPRHSSGGAMTARAGSPHKASARIDAAQGGRTGSPLTARAGSPRTARAASATDLSKVDSTSKSGGPASRVAVARLESPRLRRPHAAAASNSSLCKAAESEALRNARLQAMRSRPESQSKAAALSARVRRPVGASREDSSNCSPSAQGQLYTPRPSQMSQPARQGVTPLHHPPVDGAQTGPAAADERRASAKQTLLREGLGSLGHMKAEGSMTSSCSNLGTLQRMEGTQSSPRLATLSASSSAVSSGGTLTRGSKLTMSLVSLPMHSMPMSARGPPVLSPSHSSVANLGFQGSSHGAVPSIVAGGPITDLRPSAAPKDFDHAVISPRHMVSQVGAGGAMSTAARSALAPMMPPLLLPAHQGLMSQR